MLSLASPLPEILEKVRLSGMDDGEVAGQSQQVPGPTLTRLTVGTQRLQADRILIIVLVLVLVVLLLVMSKVIVHDDVGVAVLVGSNSGRPCDRQRCSRGGGET